ncbi:MAG: sulfurtransferase-like selenium metabolism protein YedF [Oscillospiraceae bacterium]
MAKILVNAIGEPCPVPVVKATRALGGMTEPGTLEVHVDNEVAVENLKRLAAKYQFPMGTQQTAERHFVVTVDVTAPIPTAAAAADEPIVCTDCGSGTVVAVAADVMGHGDDALGKVLLKGFLFAVSQLPVLPQTILFYNGGAKLTVEGSDSLEDLRGMAAQGVEILTCGTCLNFFNLTDQLAVGGVTNMYTIVEKLAEAAKVIKP